MPSATLGRRLRSLIRELRLPYGANYVVRAVEQRQFRYDPALGRRGRAGSLGEETVVLRALLSGGATGWWVPEAGVVHWIPAERQTVTYLRRYFALVDPTTAVPGCLALTRRMGLLRRYVHAECVYRVRRFSGDPRRWIGCSSRPPGSEEDSAAPPTDGRTA